MVGIGQTAGKDREGLCALLNSVAQADPHNILTGPYVCNINVDPILVRDDEQFVKTARLIETYFRSGGIQLQLNYVKPEDLAAAKERVDVEFLTAVGGNPAFQKMSVKLALLGPVAPNNPAALLRTLPGVCYVADPIAVKPAYPTDMDSLKDTLDAIRAKEAK